jgi:hypothetical protein
VRRILALALITSAGAVNLAYVLAVYGDRGGLLWTSLDQFADFVKYVLSYPGPHVRLPDPLGFGELIGRYMASTAYIEGIGNTHVPPLTATLAGLSRQAMGIVPPMTLYVTLAAGLTTCLLGFVARIDWRWALATAASYPFWFMLDRGNLFAGLTALCLIAAIVRAKADWAGALLFAIAISIRPNAAIVALAMLAVDFRFALRLATVLLPLNLICAGAASLLNPDYTPSTFLEGMARYRANYVEGADGVAFGSSLHGGLRFLFDRQAPGGAGLLALVFLPLAFIHHRARQLSYAGLVFVCLAAYALATTVFGDYHLLVFVAPLMLVKRSDPAFWPILLSCCFVLAPKNYQAPFEHSWQVALNPAVLLLGMLAVVAITVVGARRPTIGRANPAPI